MARSTGIVATFAIVLSWLLVTNHAAAIQCYEVIGSNFLTSTTSTSITISGTATASTQYTVCLTYPITGSLSGGVTASGTGGQGLVGGTSCSDLPSTAQATAQANWDSLNNLAASTGKVKVGTPQCCSTSMCNTGLGVTFSQGAVSMHSLSLVNVLVMFAAALISFKLSA